MNWENIRCFLTVAESESLTAAARTLRSSPATLGRRINALEAELGFKVLRRSPTGAALTPEGEQVRALARAGADKLGELERLAMALGSDSTNAPVRVSATEPLIADVLAPRLPRLLERAPALKLNLQVATRNVRLTQREADLALRLARPDGETLIARRLPKLELACFASERYLAGRNPSKINISEEHLLAFDDSYGDIPELKWLRRHSLEARVVMRASSTRALLNAAVSGAGVATLPRFMAIQRDLFMLPAPRIPSRNPWIVYHRDMRGVHSIKTVLSWIVESCREAFG